MNGPLPELSEEAKNFKPGTFRHYKGGMYRALMVARNSEDPTQEMIVYQSIEDPSKVWVRPFKMFFESVEVDGTKKLRFGRMNI